jgi:hypothetical protein
MNQTDFFEMLGAPLTNPRWSWGAIRPEDGTVFLRVWADQMRMHSGSRFVQVTRPEWVGGPAYSERLQHVDRIRDGARCYLIICEATDPSVISPRKIKQFNDTKVLPGGRLVNLDGDWWVEVLPGVPVKEVRLRLEGGRA